MIARLLMILFAIGPLFASVDAGVWDKLRSSFSKDPLPAPPSIKVLLVHDQNAIILEVKGKYKIYDPRTSEHISTRFIGKRKTMQALQDGLSWGEEFPGIHQLLIVPDDSKTTTIVDGKEYKGSIYIYDIGGTISVVNQIDIEEYLATTLSPLYHDPLPEEMMNAVVIPARTYAYYQAANSKTPYWDVDAEKVGYGGYAASKRPQQVERAIHNTQYMILSQKGKNGWVVNAFPALWRPLNGGKMFPNTVYSKLTFEEGIQLAKTGKDASQILERAFPESSIDLMHYAPVADAA